MANPDRLTGLDASFLALEDAGAHMHVGSCLLFDGDAPDYEAFVAELDPRLHLVPRYRQKLAFPPLTQARPVWVDDPHFNPGYHVRHTALPEPASLEQLRTLPPGLPGPPRGPPGPAQPGAAPQPGRARAGPAPGPRQAAVGDLARR